MKFSDAMLLLLSQTTDFRPKRLSHRIILMTFTLASLKMMNDFYSNMVLFHYDQDEVLFESYKDLNNSQLKYYFTDKQYLKSIQFDDQYLSSIISRINSLLHIETCAELFYEWDDLACISDETTLKLMISKYRNQDGSASMKIAKPPILTHIPLYYAFRANSPYTEKFLQMMRRFEETRIWYVPALLVSNVLILEFNKEFEATIGDPGTNAGQLVVTICFGFFLSVVMFILEMLKSNACKKLRIFFAQVFEAFLYCSKLRLRI